MNDRKFDIANNQTKEQPSIRNKPYNRLNNPSSIEKSQKYRDQFVTKNNNVSLSPRIKTSKQSILDVTFNSLILSENKTENFSCNNFSSKSQVVFG